MEENVAKTDDLKNQHLGHFSSEHFFPFFNEGS